MAARVAASICGVLLVAAGCSAGETGSVSPGSGADGTTATSSTTTSSTIPTVDLSVHASFADGRPADIEVRLAIDGTAMGPAVAVDGTAIWHDLPPGEATVTAWNLCDDCASYFAAAAVSAELSPGVTDLDLFIEPVELNRTRSGVIAEPEVWTGEVRLTGSVLVVEGGSLTIAPGTHVLVPPTDDEAYLADLERLQREVETPDLGGPAVMGLGGPVIGLGTVESPVRFSASDAGGVWGGLAGWLDLRFVEADGFTTIAGNASDRFSHLTLHGAGQSACFRTVGFDIIVHNSIFIECPALSDLGEPVATDPFVFENNTLVTTGAPRPPAITFVAQESSEFMTSPVVFRNNLVSGIWPVGVNLGTQPFSGESTFGHNGFVEWGWPRRAWKPQYSYDGSYTLSNGRVLQGLNALDWAWSDAFGVTWSSSRTYDFLHPYSQFAFGGGYRLEPGSGAIDWGDPNLLDADGSFSDIGAFGGPLNGAWDDPAYGLPCPDLIADALCMAALEAAPAAPLVASETMG